jgi:alpha(1,3/1,4) fucosyltransferase
MVKFFELMAPQGLDCYGECPPNLKKLSMYKGKIPGHVSSEEKISVLSNYRFCLCFENTPELKGYITEKIFSCFAAGSVPIYWGFENIERYIPKSCFIDYRDFQNPRTLYRYITMMTPERHEQYVEEIKRYLESDQAKMFSVEAFDDLMYQAIND